VNNVAVYGGIPPDHVAVICMLLPTSTGFGLIDKETEKELDTTVGS
jgi:hypothetical protein